MNVPHQINIITGLSGAGKSVAIKSIEDFGGFCVDNMVAALIAEFIKLIGSSDYSKSIIALGVDVRSRGFMDKIFDALSQTEKIGYAYRIIFLEASNRAILRRYSESRHRHPLSEDRESLKQAIEREREKLAPLREKANIIIDTTNLSPHQLKQRLKDILFEKGEKALSINIIAFGYKYGIPEEVDMLIDTRFLPNPHYRSRLSGMDGNDLRVKKFVMNNDISREFLKKYKELLGFLLPNYIREGKSYFNIGVGCTGGRHRSVVISNEISKYLRRKKHEVSVTCRDIDK
jgi:UPF0042 nucleotide-binding protein